MYTYPYGLNSFKKGKIIFSTHFIAIYFVLLCFHVAQAGLQVSITEAGIGTLSLLVSTCWVLR